VIDLSVLFEPSRLIFTIPMLVAFLFGGLALVGLFDFEGLDLDVDTDADVSADVDVDFDADVASGVAAESDVEAEVGVEGGGGFLQLLGLGLVPLTLTIVLLGFSFGWTGLLLTSLFGEAVSEVVGGGFSTTSVLAIPAAVAAIGVTAPLSRFFAPLFRDYGKAPRHHELIGKTAVLTTGSVDDTFGSASITMPGRGRIEISARTDPVDDAESAAMGYGDRVLIYDYDAARNVYLVAPHNSTDEA